MGAFVEMRKMITETDDLREMMVGLENRYDDQFKAVFSALQEIIRDEPANHKATFNLHLKLAYAQLPAFLLSISNKVGLYINSAYKNDICKCRNQ